MYLSKYVKKIVFSKKIVTALPPLLEYGQHKISLWEYEYFFSLLPIHYNLHVFNNIILLFRENMKNQN